MQRISAAELRHVSVQTDSVIKGLLVMGSYMLWEAVWQNLLVTFADRPIPAANQLIQIVMVNAPRLLLQVREESTRSISLAHSTL